MTTEAWWAHFTPYEWSELAKIAPEEDWQNVARVELLRRALEGGAPCRMLKSGGLDETDLCVQLRELGGRLVMRRRRGWGATDEVYAWPDGLAVLYLCRTDVRIDFATSNEQLFEQIEALARRLRRPEQERNTINVLVAAGGRLQLHPIEHAGEPLQPGNYNEDAVESYERLLADLRAKAPAGRLSVVEGPTGTGKTFLLRALVHALKDACFMLFPPATMKHLTDPQLLTLLIESHEEQAAGTPNPFVLLLEDADEAMVKRMADNMAAIAALLNMTDGMLGRLLDVRIVATTNSKHVDLDPALLRRGRLSARVHTRLLHPEAAAAIYARLLGSNGNANDRRKTKRGWTRDVSLADVYATAYEDGWRPPEPEIDCAFPGEPGHIRMRRTASLRPARRYKSRTKRER